MICTAAAWLSWQATHYSNSTMRLIMRYQRRRHTMECSQPAASTTNWSVANQLHRHTMECSQPAASTTNWSLIVSSCIKAFPGRPTNSDSTLHRAAHLDDGVIGCHQCITSHTVSAPASPTCDHPPLALSRMPTVHHLHPCPHPTHHSHD